jgi:hypothetical protein
MVFATHAVKRSEHFTGNLFYGFFRILPGCAVPLRICLEGFAGVIPRTLVGQGSNIEDVRTIVESRAIGREVDRGGFCSAGIRR